MGSSSSVLQPHPYYVVAKMVPASHDSSKLIPVPVEAQELQEQLRNFSQQAFQLQIAEKRLAAMNKTYQEMQQKQAQLDETLNKMKNLETALTTTINQQRLELLNLKDSTNSDAFRTTSALRSIRSRLDTTDATTADISHLNNQVLNSLATFMNAQQSLPLLEYPTPCPSSEDLSSDSEESTFPEVSSSPILPILPEVSDLPLTESQKLHFTHAKLYSDEQLQAKTYTELSRMNNTLKNYIVKNPSFLYHPTVVSNKEKLIHHLASKRPQRPAN